MVVFKRKNSGLRYLRVADALRAKVAEGTYQPGECLPRQHDLAKEYNVAFGTLKQALDLLEGEGYVVRKVGQGTYASLPEEHIETALVVDDEKSIRKFLTRFLAECGWKSVAVESGRIALEKLEERRFDLILLDLVLPDLDGAKTFREIRSRDPEANVVIVTAHPDSGLMSEALEVGPFAMIRKPFTLEEFRTLLNTVARRTDSRRDERGTG